MNRSVGHALPIVNAKRQKKNLYEFRRIMGVDEKLWSREKLLVCRPENSGMFNASTVLSHRKPFPWHSTAQFTQQERRLSEQMKQLTIEQARAVHAISPVPWKLVETSEGWTVETGEAKLVVTNGRRPRVFKSLEAAVRQLRERVGVTNFQVETVRT